MKKKSNITVFQQHGFYPSVLRGDNQEGSCPFCQKEDKFYINVNTKQWDCKYCLKKGGYRTFLNEVAKRDINNFSDKIIYNIAKKKELSPIYLRKTGVGYNHVTGRYTLPVLSYDKSNYHDIRIYLDGVKGKSKFISSVGASTGLFNWHLLNENEKGRSDTVWICEGEWDLIAWYSIIDNLYPEDVIVCVPGAGTFKAEWQGLFIDKDVKVLYDNDEKGVEGSIKVYNTLIESTKSLKFLYWDEAKQDKYDIKDLVNSGLSTQDVYGYVTEHLQDYPKVNGTERLKKPTVVTYDGAGLSAQEVRQAYNDNFFIRKENAHVIDVLYGTVIANRLPGDPLWLHLIAPSGMTKTELISSISDAKNMHPVSNLTSKSLISGSPYGEDPSLIPKFNNGIALIKDLTPLLQAPEIERNAVFGILRDAFDGECSKAFGTKAPKRFKSKFGIITGVTPIIEAFTESETSLGERFIRYKLDLPSDDEEHFKFLQSALDNFTKEDAFRKDLKNIANNCLDYNFDFDIDVPNNIQEKILWLAIWISTIRGTIYREKFSKEVLFAPIKELATRVSKQLNKLILGISAFRRIKKITKSEYDVLKFVARSTVPGRLERIVHFVNNSNENLTSKEIAESINLTITTTNRLLENLNLLGVLDKVKDQDILNGTLKITWKMKKSFKALTEKCEVYV